MYELMEVEFWEGRKAEIDMRLLKNMSVPVKGQSASNPCRCIEVFCNYDTSLMKGVFDINIDLFNLELVTKYFLPRIQGRSYRIDDNVYHPPFNWKDCLPINLAVNFTYNTNAFYRIFSNLAQQGYISTNSVYQLVDKACVIISHIYKIEDSAVLKNINNNINMYIISKIVEVLVGRKIYNAENQEPIITTKTLHSTLDTIDKYEGLTIKSLMALSLGRGVAFFENTINKIDKGSCVVEDIDSRTNSYLDRKISIDYRQHMIDYIHERTQDGDPLSMCVILDDTSESIFDLLWLQKILKDNKLFSINLLVNIAQVSINFSSKMLKKVMEDDQFKYLSSQLNSQVFIYETYSPLISYQSNLLSDNAQNVIDNSDFVYIKGLNFFETCQISHKDTYYAFVVYGPISKTYTGLNNYDAIFAYVPKGMNGYVHNIENKDIVTLRNICLSS